MSRTTKSAFVTSAGTAFEVVKALSDAVNSLGSSDDDLHQLISNRDLARQVAALLVGNVTFPLAIDYDQSLASKIAAGKYDYTAPDITEKNFPVGSGETNVETVLVHLDRNASDEEVLAELNRQGLRPATMVELLAFGAQHPDRQHGFSIIALGSVRADPQGYRTVGYLWENSASRGLDLRWLGYDWNANYRFLAVRNSLT